MWLCPRCGCSNSSFFIAKCCNPGCGHVNEEVAMRIIKLKDEHGG
jgi:hypothetical protein